MPKILTFPFVRLLESPLAMSDEWMLVRPGEEPGLLADHVEEWDYQVDLLLRRRFRLDPRAIRESCQLEAGTAILLKVSVHSPAAHPKKRRASTLLGERRLTECEPLEFDMEGTVTGSSVFTAFELLTELLLAEDSPSPRRGIASKAGSRLYQEEKRVRLEGAMGRFPVQEADLSDTGTPGCAWKLDWSPGDWEEDYYQGMVLYLNTGNPRVREAVQSGDRVFSSIMRFDIARQLVTAALESEEFVSRVEDFEAESLGHFVRSLIDRCFPEVGLLDLAHELATSPGLFEAKLQSSLDIMGGA